MWPFCRVADDLRHQVGAVLAGDRQRLVRQVELEPMDLEQVLEVGIARQAAPGDLRGGHAFGALHQEALGRRRADADRSGDADPAARSGVDRRRLRRQAAIAAGDRLAGRAKDGLHRAELRGVFAQHRIEVAADARQHGGAVGRGIHRAGRRGLRMEQGIGNGEVVLIAQQRVGAPRIHAVQQGRTREPRALVDVGPRRDRVGRRADRRLHQAAPAIEHAVIAAHQAHQLGAARRQEAGRDRPYRPRRGDVPVQLLVGLERRAHAVPRQQDRPLHLPARRDRQDLGGRGLAQQQAEDDGNKNADAHSTPPRGTMPSPATRAQVGSVDVAAGSGAPIRPTCR